MKIRRLRYFLAVAEERNFTRAADRLRISQPPLSVQIRALEREIGAPLFLRRPRGVDLTEAGKLMMREARDILGRVDKAAVAVQRQVRGDIGSIVVGFAGATYLTAEVPAIIRSYRERYPDVTVQTEQSETHALVSGMLAGRIDAAFIWLPIAAAHAFRIVLIAEQEMVAVLPVGHRLCGVGTIPLTALRDDTFTMPPRRLAPGFHDAVTSALRKAGCGPRIGQEATQITSIPAMVAAGFGVSLAPKCVSQIGARHVAYRPVAGTVPRAAIALAVRRVDMAPAARNLLAVAKQAHPQALRTA